MQDPSWPSACCSAMSHLLSSFTIWLGLVRLVINLLSSSRYVYKDCPTTYWDLKSQFCFHNPSLLSIRILVLFWELSERWETLNLWHDFELAICKFPSWSRLRMFHVSCCTSHKGPTWNLNNNYSLTCRSSVLACGSSLVILTLLSLPISLSFIWIYFRRP